MCQVRGYFKFCECSSEKNICRFCELFCPIGRHHISGNCNTEGDKGANRRASGNKACTCRHSSSLGEEFSIQTDEAAPGPVELADVAAHGLDKMKIIILIMIMVVVVYSMFNGVKCQITGSLVFKSNPPSISDCIGMPYFREYLLVLLFLLNMVTIIESSNPMEYIVFNLPEFLIVVFPIPAFPILHYTFVVVAMLVVARQDVVYYNIYSTTQKVIMWLFHHSLLATVGMFFMFPGWAIFEYISVGMFLSMKLIKIINI